MGISVQAIFAEARLSPLEAVLWGEPIPWEEPGVYVLALSPNPQASNGLVNSGHLPPAIGARWLTEQPIIYIGKAGGPDNAVTLRKRLTQFYRHQWGKSAPHNGGQDVHLLKTPIWIFAAFAPDPRPAEKAMIAAFKAQVGHRPFANRTG